MITANNFKWLFDPKFILNKPTCKSVIINVYCFVLRNKHNLVKLTGTLT